MLGTKHLFADCQRTPEEWPRSRKIGLTHEAIAEPAEEVGRLRMLGAKNLFTDCQRAFVE